MERGGEVGKEKRRGMGGKELKEEETEGREQEGREREEERMVARVKEKRGRGKRVK